MGTNQLKQLKRRDAARVLAMIAMAAALAIPLGSVQGLVLMRPGGGNAPPPAPVLGAPGGAGAGGQNNPSIEPPQGNPGEPGVAPTPPNPNDRDPGGMMDRAASGSQVYVDDSFGSVEKLRTAIRYANQGQSQIAITTFQEIITAFGQKLVYLNDGSYASITDYVREKLLQMPAVKQGMYDQLFGGEAKAAVDGAIARHDLAGLIRVCDRYFPSTAALTGLSQAAEWYFERGEFEAAARVWEQLLNHPMGVKNRADFLFRAATAAALAQNAVSAKALRARLEKDFPDATGTVSGKETRLLAKLDEVMAMPPWVTAAAPGADEWPAFGGGPSRSRLLNVNASIGARLWSVPLADDPASAAAASDASTEAARLQRQRMLAQQAAQQGINLSGINEDTGGRLTSFAVLSNGAIFVNTGERVIAVSANAGTRLAEYPKAQATPSNPPPLTRSELLIRARYGNAALQNTAHNSVSVYGDQAFAVLGGGGAGGQIIEGEIYDVSGRTAPGTSSRVVCLKRDTLDEQWVTQADAIKLDGNAARLSFVGSPTVTPQGVFVMARRQADPTFVQQYLVRLDAKTGSPTWSCYLCSTSSGMGYNIYNGMLAGTVAVPTLVDDVVYISSDQGADCAVDANVGRIMWLRVVDSAEKLQGPGQSPSARQQTTSWKLNPPLIIGEKMLACDNGQSLRVYDRWTGKLLSRVNAADLGMGRIDVIAGAVDSHVVLTGSADTTSVTRVMAIDIDEFAKRDAQGNPLLTPEGEKPGKLMPSWVSDIADAGRALGRPFLTTAALYVPFEKKLVHIDIKSGVADPWEWPRTEKDVPGKPGNLLVTSEQVVVVNDFEIAGYSKFETARDNRLAEIKARPADPAPHLALAEISFRTNHAELAHEHMKDSIDLANAGDSGGAGANKPMADILKRLYQVNLNFAEQLLGKDDTAQRDDARFYYEQCKAAARDPEQQAEWRLRLAELSLKQKKPEEAATLYGEVLSDPALRAASYREADNVSGAGTTAELRIRKLVIDNGPAVYKRFEDQAVALLAKSRAGRDLAGLQQVVDAFPNSNAALDAATDLATAYREKQDWDNARHVLWWLEPRARGEAQARAIADLVTVCIGLKKYPSAGAWAARGARQFGKDPFESSAGQKITFADVKAQVAAAGAPDIEGRLPVWHFDPSKGITAAPPMDLTPLDNDNLLEGRLLAPAESTPALRQANLLFLQKADSLRIYDLSKSPDIARDPKAFTSVTLPVNQPAILLGASPETAVLMQRDRAIGVDLKTQKLWSVTLQGSPMAGTTFRTGPVRVVVAPNVNNIGQQMQINGQMIVVGPDGVMQDANGNLFTSGPGAPMQGAGDAEASHDFALNSLTNRVFTAARIFNNRLVVIAGNPPQVQSIDIATGQSSWNNKGVDHRVKLPEGRFVALAGNEDVIVVQVDSPDKNSSTFLAIDADTGNLRKTLKIDGEHAAWRAVGDDGTLFVITDQTVAAYDLVGASNQPLWRNAMPTRFASAAQLTLDGLIFVDNNLNVMCLSLDSGDRRWPLENDQRLNLTMSQTNTLRSFVDGDAVIFQTDAPSNGSTSGDNRTIMLRTQTGVMAWNNIYGPNTPSLVALQETDLYVVELAMGSNIQTSSLRAVSVIFHARAGGKLVLTTPLTTAANTREAPALRGWQVLDGGIAFESADGVHFWRNLTASPK